MKLLSLPYSTPGTWLKFPDCKEQLTVTVVCYCTESPTVSEPCLVPVLNLPLSFFLHYFVTISLLNSPKTTFFSYNQGSQSKHLQSLHSTDLAVIVIF